MRSFLLIGQSNMAGRGELGEVPEIVNTSCFMLRNGLFRFMREPISTDRPVVAPPGCVRAGIGLGASFADALQRHTGDEIGLVMCAEGGSSLSQWLPGQILYDNAVAQARLAMRSSVLSGILWHQGENDCGSPDDAKAYAGRLSRVILSLRADLGCPRLPFLIGTLGDFVRDDPDSPYADDVNRALQEAAQSTADCALVSAAGLSCKPDGMHFTSAACRTLGERYFEAYKRFL